MTATDEIDLTGKSLDYLRWLRKRWHRLFGITILNDVKLSQELARIEAAIKAHPDNPKHS